jgi:CDP-glucose 4,6-dehydratase
LGAPEDAVRRLPPLDSIQSHYADWVHYLVTGHTGFKGSWLSLMLFEAGHQVSGVSLDPIDDSLFESAELAGLFRNDERQDIRDAAAVQRIVERIDPDVVLHLAAQPLVRESYRDPRGTLETNVMGTLNVLSTTQEIPGIQARLIVTTDKVYRNVGQQHGYVEADPLGGDDPYSASKAMADILTTSWVHSFGGPPTAVARAGNVIGGGDVSRDRLIPDAVSAFQSGVPVALRYPDAIRPWQHVLDCLNGYLMLTDALLSGSGQGSWNFGPGVEGFRTVSEVVDRASSTWPGAAGWQQVPGEHPHEAAVLALDAARAESDLGWRNRLDFDDSIAWTMDWYAAVMSGRSARDATLDQIRAFASLTEPPA